MASSPFKKLTKRTAGFLLMSYISSFLLTACLSSSSDVSDNLICFDVKTKTEYNPKDDPEVDRVCHGINQDYDGDGVTNQYDGAPGDYHYFTSVSSDDRYYEISNIQQLRAITDFECPPLNVHGDDLKDQNGNNPLQTSGGCANKDSNPLGTIANRLAAHYRLSVDIDASSISSWEPIGSETSDPFLGEFEGNGKAISNLSLSGTTPLNGLFGYLSGSVSNLILSNSRVEISNISIEATELGTGILAAVVQSEGRVNNVYAINPDINVEIPSSSSAYLAVGGLVGLNQGEIINSRAIGINITAAGKLNAGGLVGSNASFSTISPPDESEIIDSYSTGIINRTGEGNTGGFVGNNNDQASIKNSYTTAEVIGTSNVGGFVGKTSGTISNSYATGAVIGTSNVGGFVGNDSGTISNSYATGNVTGTSNVGGFIGEDSGTISGSYYSGTVDIGDDSAATDAGIEITLDDLKALTIVGTDWSANNWAGMDGIDSSGFLPTLRSYVVDMEGNQIQGDILCAQPKPRVKADGCGDSDDDGVMDRVDNCPTVVNGAQLNTDGDTEGDVCDDDDDNDGVVDTDDACPQGLIGPHAAADDTNGDGCKDFEEGDYDSDGDGVADISDNCPIVHNASQIDTDGDTEGDVCDDDDDNDGIDDTSDQCPTGLTGSHILTDTNGGINSDGNGDFNGDGCRDFEEGDYDNDGVADISDNCPIVSNALQMNDDGDTEGDVCDEDDDNDGVADISDQCPTGLTGSHTLTDTNGGINSDGNGDFNGDGCRDFEEGEYDNDGVADTDDQCQGLNTEINWTSTSSTDEDADGCKDDTEDIDDDNDGLIEISTESELNNIRYNLEGTSYAITTTDAGTTSGCHIDGCNGYELINDISVIADWSSVGNTSQGFATIFDGNNYKITITTIITNDLFRNSFGFFGVTSFATIRNLHIIVTYNIVQRDIDGQHIGALVGSNNNSRIENSSAEANIVSGPGKGYSIGVLVGYNTDSLIISCAATGDATGGEGGGNSVGVLVGYNTGSPISASTATGDAEGEDGGNNDVGVLVGSNTADSPISDSNATGTATGGNGADDNVGGVVGYNINSSISASIAIGDVNGGAGADDNVGGVVGYNYNSQIEGSYTLYNNVNGGAGDNDNVGGVSCLSGDIIGDYLFNNELKIGQKLFFGDMAHYTMVKNTHFNGIRPPAIAVSNIASGELELCKNFEYEDYKNRLS